MPETWPSNVPYAPHLDSLKVKPFRDPLRTEMEDGPARLRPSSTLTVATMSFQILMNSDELDSFMTWVRDAIAQGTAPFVMSVWKPTGFVVKQCRFVSPYQLSASVDGVHAVQISIDVEDY